MKIYTKKLVFVMLFIACLMVCFSQTLEVFAVNKKVYTMSEHTISKIMRSKGKLTIVVDKGCLYSGNYSKKLKIRKISIKIAKNCKWLDWNIGYYNGNGPKYRKTTYSKVKKEIEGQRDEYIRIYKNYGDQLSLEEFEKLQLYDSPIGLKIVVKNNRIIQVITSRS